MADNRIGRYELLEKIGVGAITTIYKARDTETGDTVAVKDLVISDRSEEKYLRHVRNEFKVLRTLWQNIVHNNGHSSIVEPFELLKPGLFSRTKRFSLVMSYIEGKDLRAENRYPLGQLVHIFRQIAGALAKIHAAGYVHADMKPENVMVTPRGDVTLVDFGFACEANARAQSIRGTREYMAPEQMQLGFITPQTDLYNFGASMYYLLTSQHLPTMMGNPGDGGVFVEGIKLRTREITDRNPAVPERLARLVVDCCQREPIKRISSAHAAVEALDGILRGFNV